MESGGLITKSDTSVGWREKLTYRITDVGKEALKNWLQEKQASNELKYETLLKLFFGGADDKSVSIRNIEVFEEQVEADLKLLKSYCDTLEKVMDEENHIYYYLTASFGVDTYEAYLKWCAKAKKILGSKETGSV